MALRFLLFRLAAQNIGRRRLRALLLGLSVMLAVGVGFASFTGGWALRSGVATSFSRMGADIVVVPLGTLINITSTLLTVQPTEQELDGGLANRLRAIPGVGVVAPQRIVRAQADGHAINLIAFDPLADFTVQPWLRPDQRLALEKGSALIGERVTDSSPGDSLTICGRPLHVEARLTETGVGPFDESYFVSFATLDGLIAAWQAICNAAGIPISAKPADGRHVRRCSGGRATPAQPSHRPRVVPTRPRARPSFGAAAATGPRRFRPTSHVRDRSDSGN